MSAYTERYANDPAFRECIKERQRKRKERYANDLEFRERVKEQRRRSMNKWAEANREESRRRPREWARAHPEENRARALAWARANPERVRENGRLAYEQHPERYKAQSRTRKARKRGNGGYATAEQIAARVACEPPPGVRRVQPVEARQDARQVAGVEGRSLMIDFTKVLDDTRREKHLAGLLGCVGQARSSRHEDHDPDGDARLFTVPDLWATHARRILALPVPPADCCPLRASVAGSATSASAAGSTPSTPRASWRSARPCRPARTGAALEHPAAPSVLG
jgi:hypothetical protein